ncbi:MAG: thymidine phosphorylase [Deltaproteobacteria bacterium]|nr:thymidine phosphorylase [Deltaproteobacteria bacterium]
MHIEDILTTMRSGEAQSPEAIEAALTRAMTRSGDVLTWPDGPLCIDKHSTGGVGDKVSLVLAPLWAELGLRVPMISGRGLGHTGGTLDKLEAIPGYRTDLTEAEMSHQLAEVGCFITGQTGDVAPSDRVLYALRNETSTVESVPLIVGSILSKKLAEGVQRLVLDVKTGSGAFMEDLDAARRLAGALVRVATGAGIECQAVISAMDRPLGCAVGNALEVVEAVDCLKGGGPEDLRQLTIALAQHPAAERVLASGAAYERFRRMVAAQGGDADAVGTLATLQGAGTDREEVAAYERGIVRQVDARGIGRAAFLLGAGRRRSADPVDFGVGLLVHVKPGDAVTTGQPLATLFHRNGHALAEGAQLVRDAITLGSATPHVPPLIHEVVEA